MSSIYAENPALSPSERAALQDTPRPKRPSVCFLAPAAWPMLAESRDIPVIGGAELQMSVIAPELARRGFDVSMICLDFGQEEGSVLKGIRMLKMCKPDAGIPVVRFIHPRLTSLWQALKRADADVYYQRCAAVHTGYLAAFCRTHGITYQSFWTLTANPDLLASAAIRTPASRLRRTPAQVFFRYLTQQGVVPLTGTTSVAHMREDLAIFEFELTADEQAAVTELMQ